MKEECPLESRKARVWWVNSSDQQLMFASSFFSCNHSLSLPTLKLMWVDRCDSWGQANTVCPTCLLNVLKMDSGLSKTQHSVMHSCIEESWASLPTIPKTKRYVWTVAPHGSSCKGHTYCCMEGLMSIQRERLRWRRRELHFNTLVWFTLV